MGIKVGERPARKKANNQDNNHSKRKCSIAELRDDADVKRLWASSV